MLEILDLKLAISKSEYGKQITSLRASLRDLQLSVRAAGIPVIILFEGWATSRKGDSIGSLVYPLDPRGFKVYTTREPNEEERLRPFLWRFWIRLPGKGEFVFLDRSWYRRMLEDRVDGVIDSEGAARAAAEIREFERQLTDNGVVLIKFWLHIARKEQKKRLAKIQTNRYEKWRPTQKDWKKQRSYKKYLAAVEDMLAAASTANAPWILVEAHDHRFRRTKIFEQVNAALRRALTERGIDPDPEKHRTKEPIDPGVREQGLQVTIDSAPTVFDRVDLSKQVARGQYKKELDRLQNRLRDLELECYQQRVGAVVVYEGWDAGGKGGNIKRLTQELDPRGYEVIPISSPTPAEKAHHYLWRFWRQLPKAGHMAIFDRSWYGRVLVERIEGFAKEEEWRRAFQEINEFERHIVESGAVLIKFWLHMSLEEQLRRFEQRENTPHKWHKITEEDWRNRAKWNKYRAAAAEMIERTSTSYAPWTIVEAENKLYARLKTISTVISSLEHRLGV